MKDTIRRLLKSTIPGVIASICCIVLSIVSASFIFDFEKRDIYFIYLGVCIGASVVFVILAVNRKLFKTPTTLTLSLLGLPHSGKTVYLTVLFRELLIHGNLPGFSLYGEETIERVQEDYKSLQLSHWLPATDIMGSNVFYYRAIVNSTGMIPKPRYKLEIADYAGEYLESELVSNHSFLHRTKYFKYVLDSDIIFPIIDMEKFAKNGRDYVIEVEQSIVAAFDIIRQNKTSIGKCKTPVCLLFLKSDCIHSTNSKEADILKVFNNILSYFSRHYFNFEKFFVSAISPEPFDTNEVGWGKNLTPDNVIQPLEWALRVVRR